MSQKIVDLHTHSKYSRACSPLLELPNIATACEQKGIDIVSTGDFTHPKWFEHLEKNLDEVVGTGLYKLKVKDESLESKVRFIIGTEISCIYKHAGKVRRVHLLVFAPNLNCAERFNRELLDRGCNLNADGRPIIGVPAKDILKICLEIDHKMMVIPAHAWTPWFAVFGSKSGYKSLEECFEELTPEIFAIETGLSSDPTMNHRLSQLDKITLVSNSDAHSLDNLGREANILNFSNDKNISYRTLREILKSNNPKSFISTIEFYPEEGMYFNDGHSACKISLTPAETKKVGGICPKCKKPLTIGVQSQINALADRTASQIPENKFIPHRYIVPLKEIISEVLKVGKKSKKVNAEYLNLLKNFGSEFNILLNATSEELDKVTSPKICAAILKMRSGQVQKTPGYDGVYGVIKVVV